MSYTPTEWESTDVVTATRLNALEQAVGDLNMSYTPNVWQNGDILTADKMNALEQAVASGGGSNDFTTATVVVTSPDPDRSYDSCPVAVEANEAWSDAPETIVPLYFPSDTTTMTVTVPLYKGSCVWDSLYPEALVVTGDIDLLWPGACLIRGNGTVTIVID